VRKAGEKMLAMLLGKSRIVVVSSPQSGGKRIKNDPSRLRQQEARRVHTPSVVRGGITVNEIPDLGNVQERVGCEVC
jgi:hypothetical protein